MSPQSVVEATVSNGGGTFNARTFEPFNPRDGYAVAIKRYGRQLPLDDLTPRVVEEYARTLRDDLYLGTWVNNGLVYLDGSYVTNDYELAMAIAVGNGELAIWDFANSAEIATAVAA